jgi:hypothetical protein
MNLCRIFQDDSNIKGRKLEIFVAQIFTQIKPVWVGDLETRPKNPKCLSLRPFITLYFPRFLFLALSATLPKSTNWRFSSLNQQNFEFFGLVPKSPTHTGLICVKKTRSRNLKLGPLKEFSTNRQVNTQFSYRTKAYHCLTNFN